MLGKIVSLFAELSLDDRKFQSGIRGVKSSLGGVTSQLGQVGAAVGVAFSAGAAINAASQFGKQLTNIESLGGRTKEQMAALNAELLAMGKNTFLEGGPQAAVNAFYDIASGIQGADKQMAIFKASIATAEAGQADLTATTSGLVSVMNAYNFEAGKATMVSDVFTRTVGLGVGSMNEFVSAMSPIAGMSAQMGIEFDDLGAMMAFLTTKGIGVSESATQIRSTMSALLTPNKKMLDQFQKLGISSGQAAIKQYGLVGTLELLKKSVGGSEQEMGEMLGRIEAVSGAMQLTNGGFGEFAKTFETGLSGATAAAQAIQLDSFSAKSEKLKNQLSGLGIEIGQVLIPPLSQLVDWVTQGITSLNKIHPAIVPVTAGILALGAALGIISPALGAIKMGLMALFSPIGLLTAAIVLIGGLAIHHFGGLDKLLIAASTSARQLVQIVGYVLFDTLNRAGVAAGQLGQILKIGVGGALNWVKQRAIELGNTLTPVLNTLKQIVDALPLPQSNTPSDWASNFIQDAKDKGKFPFFSPSPTPSGNAGGGGGFTPFASYGQGSGPIKMVTGERRPEMVTFDGGGNWSVKPMNRGRGGGGGGAHYTIIVADRDLESRIESILERELAD